MGNPSTWESEAMDLCMFKASMVYRGSSRKAQAAQGAPVLKPLPHPPKKKEKKN